LDRLIVTIDGLLVLLNLLLITNEQPTFMRRDSAAECEENPR
jgi:hypothetical protein